MCIFGGTKNLPPPKKEFLFFMDDPLPGNLGTFGITRLLATDTSATDGIATKIILLVVLVILSAFFSAVETS